MIEKSTFKKLTMRWEDLASHVSKPQFAPEFALDKKLKDLEKIGDSFYYILNLNGEIEYISSSLKNVLGINNSKISTIELLSFIHPDDLTFYLNCQGTIISHWMRLPNDRIQKYKSRFTYRMQNVDGNYHNFVHQGSIIEGKENETTVRGLVVLTDVSFLSAPAIHKLCIVGQDGEESYYNVPIEKNSLVEHKEMFTPREKEILKLILKGKKSKEIAQSLEISKLTVDTHRKNIFAKTKSKSVPELINMSHENGWGRLAK